MSDDRSIHDSDAFIDTIRVGQPLLVSAYLLKMPDCERKEVLTKQFWDEDDQLYSPFLLAVFRGHYQIVQLFLTLFSVNPNDDCHIGKLVFDNGMIDGVTPLWCAAAMSHLDIVNILILHDASVDKCTKNGSSPLRAASSSGSIEIVKLLVDNGATIDLANIQLNNSLMVASYGGYLEVVDYLLQCGANPNSSDDIDCYPLHYAVDGAHLSIVKTLLRHGANMFAKNIHGLSPAYCAAINCNAEIIEYVCNSVCSSKDWIEMKVTLLELLGASYTTNNEHYSRENFYKCLLSALHIREQERLFKTSNIPVDAYEYKKEINTLEELQCVRHDLDAVHIQGLIIRERILGTKCLEVAPALVHRGAVHADRFQFKRCISLWLRAMKFNVDCIQDILLDLFRFAELFCQMVSLREHIDNSALRDVLGYCVTELYKTSEHVVMRANHGDSNKMVQLPEIRHKPGRETTNREISSKKFEEALMHHYEQYNHIMLYLSFVVTKAMQESFDTLPSRKIIHQFLKYDFRDRKGYTALHLALDEATPVNRVHVRDVCSFPNADIARLFLTCGADPNAVSITGDTPLHLIVQHAKPISNFAVVRQAIFDLLDAGAHPDTKNRKRKTALDVASGVAETIVKEKSKLSLMCLCACVIREHNISYIGEVPVSLITFIEKH